MNLKQPVVSFFAVALVLGTATALLLYLLPQGDVDFVHPNSTTVLPDEPAGAIGKEVGYDLRLAYSEESIGRTMELRDLSGTTLNDVVFSWSSRPAASEATAFRVTWTPGAYADFTTEGLSAGTSTSSRDGVVEIAAASPVLWLSGFKDLVPMYQELADGHVVLFLAPFATIEVSVEDLDGLPLRDALLHRSCDRPEETNALGYQATRRMDPVRTDSNGRVLLAMPFAGGAALRVTCPGFHPSLRVGPFPSEELLVIRLTPHDLSHLRTLHGRITDAQGSPVDRAAVGLGVATSLTDGDGRYTLRSAEIAGGSRVSVFSFEQGPPVEKTLARDGTQVSVDEWELNVCLDTPSATIHGRVLNDRDQPVEGVLVLLEDGTRVGGIVGYSEGYVSQTEFRPPSTDLDGRFAVRNLRPGMRRLRFIDETRLQEVAAELTAPGTYTIQMPQVPDDESRSIAGRLTTSDGEGVEGLGVRVMRPGSFETGLPPVSSAVVFSGADGKFLGTAVVVSPGLIVKVTQDRATLVTVDLDDFHGGATIVVDPWCHVRLTANPQHIQELQVLDGAGTALRFRYRVADTTYEDSSIPSSRVSSEMDLELPSSARRLQVTVSGGAVQLHDVLPNSAAPISLKL